MSGGRVFISYRRGDADSAAAARLNDRLELELEQNSIFFDIDAIPLGVDFTDYLNKKVDECDVFIVVVGRNWLDATDRLHKAQDFVRIEIEAALSRPYIPIIPVLVGDVAMPTPEVLPEQLQPLLKRNGISLPHAHFASGVSGRLVPALQSALQNAKDRIEEADEKERKANTANRPSFALRLMAYMSPLLAIGLATNFLIDSPLNPGAERNEALVQIETLEDQLSDAQVLAARASDLQERLDLETVARAQLIAEKDAFEASKLREVNQIEALRATAENELASQTASLAVIKEQLRGRTDELTQMKAQASDLQARLTNLLKQLDASKTRDKENADNIAALGLRLNAALKRELAIKADAVKLEKTLAEADVENAKLRAFLDELANQSGDGQLDRNEIAEAQGLLSALGFYAGPVDGLVGRKTLSSASQFRQRVSFPPSEKLDRRLLEALRVATRFAVLEGTVERDQSPSVESVKAIASLLIEVAPLTEAARSEFSLPHDTKGVLVTKVSAGSSAAQKGIGPGDVIVEAAQRAVLKSADLSLMVENAKQEGRKSILLLIQNKGNLRFFAVKMK